MVRDDDVDIDELDDDAILDERDARALTEVMAVLPDIGRARNADDLYLVVSQTEYLVDMREGSCECWDDRRPERPRCKHRRRVEFVTGGRAIPSYIDESAIDDRIGQHVDNEVER